MAYVKKLKENELVGGTDNTDVYPITTTNAVYTTEILPNGKNKDVSTKLVELDNDSKDLHSMNEKLVPHIYATFSRQLENGALEIVETPTTVDISGSADIVFFGDKRPVTLEPSKYTKHIEVIQPNRDTTFEDVTDVREAELSNAIGQVTLKYHVEYPSESEDTEDLLNNIKEASYTVPQNIRKYFGFSANTPSSVENLGASHFSGTVDCTVIIPTSGSGYKKIYFCVPDNMTINKVTQPEALNAPLAVEQERTINRIIQGTSYVYKMYRSVDDIDCSVSKRLTIS